MMVYTGSQDAAPDLTPEPRRDTPIERSITMDSSAITPECATSANDQRAYVLTCEHWWVSRHQPDFPPPIHWVRVCGLCGEIDSADLARQLAPPIEVDEWCREPDCRYRNWRSGFPTHKRGGDCPVQPAPIGDPRETEHMTCDCVPHLGPPHCHMCAILAGREVPWDEAHPTAETPLDLDAMGARAEAALEEVVALCQGKRWTMQVPYRPDKDSDLVIADALADVPALVAEVERLRAGIKGDTLEDLRKAAQCIEREIGRLSSC